MSYEYMGMGTARDDARAAFDRGSQLTDQGNYSAAYDAFRAANSAVPSDTAVAAMGYTAAMMGNCAQAILHFRQLPSNYTMTSQARAQRDRCEAVERDIALRPLPPELQDQSSSGAATPATEKQTWWTGDVGGMFASFFSKLGIGEQISSEAQDAAREAAGETMGPTSINEVVPGMDRRPSVVVEENPWHVKYAPHMVIGGLGFGALITLLIVMRKR